MGALCSKGRETVAGSGRKTVCADSTGSVGSAEGGANSSGVPADTADAAGEVVGGGATDAGKLTVRLGQNGESTHLPERPPGSDALGGEAAGEAAAASGAGSDRVVTMGKPWASPSPHTIVDTQVYGVPSARGRRGKRGAGRAGDGGQAGRDHDTSNEFDGPDPRGISWGPGLDESSMSKTSRASGEKSDAHGRTGPRADLNGTYTLTPTPGPPTSGLKGSAASVATAATTTPATLSNGGSRPGDTSLEFEDLVYEDREYDPRMDDFGMETTPILALDRVRRAGLSGRKGHGGRGGAGGHRDARASRLQDEAAPLAASALNV